MKVKELIERLNKCNSELDVETLDDTGFVSSLHAVLQDDENNMVFITVD